MAKLGKRAFAGIAGLAVVKQADAAVWAKVNVWVFQIYRTLAAWAHSLG